MNKEGHAVALLTGQSTVEQRIAVLDRYVIIISLHLSLFFKRFREGKERLMITTNLCARGIDIDQVNASTTLLYHCHCFAGNFSSEL